MWLRVRRLRARLAYRLAPWAHDSLTRVVIPALQDDKKVAVDALLVIERDLFPRDDKTRDARVVATNALNRLEVDR